MDMISSTKFTAKMKTLKVPQGFTAEMTTEPKWGNTGGWMVYVLKSETVELKFSQLGDGSTNFLKDGHWLTFDSRGVSASFYFLPMWSGDKTKYDLNAIVKEQLERVKEQLKYFETALEVPGTPFTIQPKQLEAYKKTLMAGKPVGFMPSGFGTGYTFYKGPLSSRSSRFLKPAGKALETFFGISPLYFETHDCD